MSDERRFLMGRELPAHGRPPSDRRPSAPERPIALTTLVEAVATEFVDDNPDRVTHRTLRLLGLHNRVSFTNAEARRFLDSLKTWKGAWKTDRIKSLSIALGDPEDDGGSGV